MLDVLACITDRHNPWLVLLAALICALSVATTLQAYDRGLKNVGRRRTRWLSIAGAVGGAGVWATHFVAMLAYDPSLPIQYGILGTGLSLLLGMAGAGLGFHVAASGRGRPLLGGILVGASIVAMHYTGIGAIRAAFHLHWNPVYVLASVGVSLAGAAAAVATHGRWHGWRGRVAAAVLLLLAIVGLHFTGMTAVTMTPDLTATVSPELISRPILAVLVGGMVFLILTAATALIVIETQSRRESLGALTIAFKGIPSAIALYDAHERLTLWNEAYAALMLSFGVAVLQGMKRETLLNEALSKLSLSASGPIGLQAAADDPMAPWEGELPDGRWLRIERRPLANGALITLLTDVTDQRRWAAAMQDARDEAEAASRAKSEFLANMSHEIRTPLNGVLGMIQAMEGDTLTAPQRKRLEVAHESGRALLGTLNDILDLTKVQAGHMELELGPFDAAALGETVASAFAGAAAAKGLALAMEVEPAVAGWWTGDALKLRKVLSNLVANALKFTLEGGVRLEIGAEEDGLQFRVRDTGIGIDPRDSDRLFERFAQADTSTTRRFGGTGLGLSICRELTALMGGAIHVESTLGEGACFIVTLGLARTEAPEQALADTPSVGFEPAEGDPILTVLVAEDNPVNQLVLRSLLEPLNVDLTVAGNGEEAVQAFVAQRFDLVLMDIQMPEMNGVEATRMIRSIEQREGRGHTPVIALTANVMVDQLETYRIAGMDGHVAKPIEIERLYAVLSQALTPTDPASAHAAA